MFFQKRAQARDTVAQVGSVTDARRPTARTAHPAARTLLATGGADASTVLDALGAVLDGMGRFALDLPHRTADVATQEIQAWRRHATLGLPVNADDRTPSVGIEERDWPGLARAVTELRRDEKESTEAIVSELRTALWTCVAAVHEAVRIDDSAEAQTGAHLALVKRAVHGTQMSTIKDEVLRALQEIDGTLMERRDAQQRQYRSLASSLDSLGRQLEAARKETETDALTGIGNRRHFDLMAVRALQLFSLARAPVTLLMIDLDKLKMINDSYGHPAGDSAITTLAQALKLVFLRQSDVICRYGGDEFAVILNNCDVLVARTLAGRLLEMVRSLPSPGMEFALGASIGVAQLEPGEDVAQWVARSDRALYRAKRQATGSVMLAAAGDGLPPVSHRHTA